MPVWAPPGVLVIGDAAHVVNGRLSAKSVSGRDLAEVQGLREWPTKAIHGFPSFFENRWIDGVLVTQQVGNVTWQRRLLRKIPAMRDLPPRMIAFTPNRVRLDEV